MKLGSLRRKLAILFGVICSLMALSPLMLWNTVQRGRVGDDIERSLEVQMQHLQVAEARGADEPVDFPAWYVSVVPNASYIDSRSAQAAVTGLPLERWLTESQGQPSFREISLDTNERYLGYVVPKYADEGWVTVTSTADREDRLADLRLRTALLALGIVVAGVGLGWYVAGLALNPARRAVSDQQGFLADAAHEMRTPLAVILASGSQALAKPRSTEEYVRSLSEIRSAAERASAGVNEMLDLVRFESGQAIPRLAPLRLDLLAEEVASSIRPESGEVIAHPADPVVVDADMALLRQALDNLVRNATRRAEQVELVAAVIDRQAVVDVLDNGPGFDPQILPRVFERYQRGDRRGDAGMGLAIVKAIVTAHGGVVAASNREEGGARVRITMPLSRNIAG